MYKVPDQLPTEWSTLKQNLPDPQKWIPYSAARHDEVMKKLEMELNALIGTRSTFGAPALDNIEIGLLIGEGNFGKH